MRIVDGEGREATVTFTGASGFRVGWSGTVHSFVEDADGNREEWSEPLCESPVRDVLAPWVWDLVADPRQVRPE